jgi:hypothetical protein
MSNIEREQRWTLRGELEFNATGQRRIVAWGTELAYAEEVEVVPASQLERAVSALERYGRHDDDCQGVNPDRASCTCGLNAALDAYGGQ